MTKNLYFCLQRSLVKIVTKSYSSQRSHISLPKHLFNKLNNEKQRDFKLRNCQIKKGYNLNFSGRNFIFLNKKTGSLKKWKNQTAFNKEKNSTRNYFYVIKNSIFMNDIESLYKYDFLENSSFFQILFSLKLKKKQNFAYLPMLWQKQGLAFDFFKSVKVQKNQPVFLLKSFVNLGFFFCPEINGQRKNKSFYLSNLFYIFFPLKNANLNHSIAISFGHLQKKILPSVCILFSFTFKYIIQKKLIQNTEYKAFVFLVNIFYIYKFSRKNLQRYKMKFKPPKVVINTTLNVDFFLMRPLFSLTRLDTFYISECLKLPLYPDQSNFRVDFLRNRIRKQILPAIRILINPQFDTILCKIYKT